MSIERELLKRFMIELTTEEDVVSLFNDIKECLVSNVYDAYEEGRKSVMSEQQAEAWIIVNKETGYRTQVSDLTPFLYHREIFEVIPLYTAPPTREPFGPEERQRISKAYSTRAEQVAFEEGIIFAKILYGIGGEPLSNEQKRLGAIAIKQREAHGIGGGE